MNGNIYNGVNKTFISQPVSITGGSPTLSACTAMYTNQIISCSGDSSITLGASAVTVNVLNADFILISGTPVNEIIISAITGLEVYSTGSTFTNNELTITNNTGGTFSTMIENFTGLTVDGVLSATTISGGTFFGDGSNLSGVSAANDYTTGVTLNGSNVLVFDSTITPSAYTVDLSPLLDDTNTFITG